MVAYRRIPNTFGAPATRDKHPPPTMAATSRNGTLSTTQPITHTNKMSRRQPTHWLICPLSPYQHPPWPCPQLMFMALWLPTNPHQAFGAWFALVTIVVSLVLVCGTNRSSDRLDMWEELWLGGLWFDAFRLYWASHRGEIKSKCIVALKCHQSMNKPHNNNNNKTKTFWG